MIMETNQYCETLPEELRQAGCQRALLLDVRPILGKGEDPFHKILEASANLAADEALCLMVGFEPFPLYNVMEGKGFQYQVEKEDGLFRVYFYRGGESESLQEPVTPAPLQAPEHMDVRHLAPPEPMMRILTRLTELGPGAQLVVHHHREPVLLYEKLKLRGYAALTRKRGEGDYLVHVLPAWAAKEA
ncbi:MAG: DUF2249 domain-containing protein [Planctomycetota bacterium]|nr:MAG: DUF2249 domain-containing protein [Planctomycetota bacterium]